MLLAVVLLALATGLLIVDAIGEAVIAQHQREVAETARDYFVSFAHEEGVIPLARALDRSERLNGASGFHYAVFANDGRLLGGAPLVGLEQLPPAGKTRIDIVTDAQRSQWEVLVQPLSIGGFVVVYENLKEREDFRRALVAGAAVALVTALGAVFFAALSLSRVLLRRAESIATTASRIAEGDLSARAPADPKGDVFDRLGVSLNAMLDRIDELMMGMRTVTDSLAHDLRSPLTRLKGALTRALSPGLGEEARLDAVEQAQNEASQALATFSALVDIARAESGLSRESMGAVDLGRLAGDIAELFGPVLEDAGQILTYIAPERPILVRAHELLLRQAVGNLLHNAARYAGPGAVVTLSIAENDGRARIVVADNGPGIPAEHRGRVQQRFVRLDAARTTPGSGLGLAIAAACAKLHGGALILEDGGPGLRAILELATAPVENVGATDTPRTKTLEPQD
jgi:signal transduction histidine kinase